VGGKNLLPMKELAALVSALGCCDVVTYIQSGNVVAKVEAQQARDLPARLSAVISDRFKLTVPVVMRTAEELATVVEQNPFIAAGCDPDTLHVSFLGSAPGPERVAQLDPQRSPPDRFEVRGREMYLCCPNGLGRTRLTPDYVDRRLGTPSTTRNWRTVLKLLELSGGG
jgi:uncharacterized protein (DUF1697 family)